MSNSEHEGTGPRSAEDDDEYPWQRPAVLPEDRAMGLELELIELGHELDETESEGGPTAPIEAEMDEVLQELGETMVPDEADEPHVEIAAPEAASPEAASTGDPATTGDPTAAARTEPTGDAQAAANREEESPS
jgi:hypothetical protein